jgi:hypothetical protein
MPLIRVLIACALAALAGCSTAAAPQATLAAYESDDELAQALARWRERAQRLRDERRKDLAAAPGAPAAPAAQGLAKSEASAERSAADSITNVQTAGVDEGGIVKRAGDHLVILRRGRLFTVRIGGDALQPVAAVNAYAADADPRGAWYDELLVSGSTVVVIGYSYARGGTEIGLFALGADGSLAQTATYHLRSFDYWSSRNYASRLVGNRLVLYTPTLLQPWGPSPLDVMPALRRWQGSATPPAFRRILPATRIHRSADDFDPHEPLALHTVTSCEIGAAALDCEASAVLGPAGRVFYVSRDAVYVWTASWRPAPSRTPSAVFRLPLSGGAPSALRAAGVPVDQLSFLEDDGGHLNVLLREAGAGEGMWGGERTAGGAALLRVPVSAFGDGRAAAQREHYRRLPAPAGYVTHNRFVGDWLLWGDGRRGAWAVRYTGDEPAIPLSPGHAVERIEAMGPHALLVGNAGVDLHFSAVRLAGRDARIEGAHVQTGARQGETRTHGFFFHPTSLDEGLVGLPILGPGRAGRHGVFAGAQGAASVLFLRERGLAFAALGSLDAQPARGQDDGCRASCVDWYGNARPIFTGGRIFALMGYELVEGRLAGDGGRERIEERRRTGFAPTARDGLYSPFN